MENLVNEPIDGWLQLNVADKTLQQAHAYAVESKSKLHLLSIPYLSFINNSLQAQPVAQMTKHRHHQCTVASADIDSVHQTSIERTYVESQLYWKKSSQTYLSRASRRRRRPRYDLKGWADEYFFISVYNFLELTIHMNFLSIDRCSSRQWCPWISVDNVDLKPKGRQRRRKDWIGSTWHLVTFTRMWSCQSSSFAFMFDFFFPSLLTTIRLQIINYRCKE